MQGEDDGPQVLQADHRDVAVNPRDLRTEGQQGSAGGAPSRAPHPWAPPQSTRTLRWISTAAMRPASLLICSTQRSARPR